MRKLFNISCIISAFIALIYFDFIQISVGHAKNELESEVKTVNNSVIETLKYFSLNENKEIFLSNIIVLNFWYPTCGACRREKSNLHKIQNKFRNEDIQFLSYCPPSLYEFSTNKNPSQEVKFNYQETEFKSGVKKSILKVAGNNKLNVDTTLNSFPNTVIISTQKDSILYFTQANIKDSDLSKIYRIIQNELDDKN